MGKVTPIRFGTAAPAVGQLLTAHIPGHTITYEVVAVHSTTNITFKCVHCVADPVAKPFKIEVFDRVERRWVKVSECDSRTLGHIYLKATGRHGLVSENR